MNFQLAGPEHEKQLRELAACAPMPGWVRVSLGREPDFFQSVNVQGRVNQVLVALDGERVAGMGCRSIRTVYINGLKTQIGYLSGLRVHPDYRGSRVLARGYAAIKTLHEQNPVPTYMTTVMESNITARDLLTSKRAGLPYYLDQGRYIVYAIRVNRKRRKNSDGMTIHNGEEIGRDRLVEYLNNEGRRRQFFPVLEEKDFNRDYLRGLNPADFHVAVDPSKEIAGVIAAWDQTAYKQNIVDGYAAPVQFLRPLINYGLRCRGFSPLPGPRQKIHEISLSFCCIRNDDPEVLRGLLDCLHDEKQGECHFLVLGLHERDPLRAALRHFPVFQLASRFYLACWDDGLEFVRSLDSSRIPHIEVATL